MEQAFIYVKGYTNPRHESQIAVVEQLCYCVHYADVNFKVSTFVDERKRGYIPNKEYRKMLVRIKTTDVKNVILFSRNLSTYEICTLLKLGVKVHIVGYQETVKILTIEEQSAEEIA